MLVSVESDDRSMCVDLFEDPEGRFGFELFRSDPEDGGPWTAVGGLSAARFETAAAAAASAQAAVPWLSTQRAKAELERWLGALGSD